jgi:hypothetical protein
MVRLQMGKLALFGLAAALLTMITIIDSGSALISGALVKVTQTITGQKRQTSTSSGGLYVLPNLTTEPHKLEANAPPFRRYVPSCMVLQGGKNVLINVNMKWGSASHQVEVIADPATQDTSISEVVDQRRNLTPVPGGASVPAGAVGRFITTHDYTWVATVSISGGQQSGNIDLPDGERHDDGHSSLNLPFPFPDALQKFSVQTNRALYGLYHYAAVNVVTGSPARSNSPLAGVRVATG